MFVSSGVGIPVKSMRDAATFAYGTPDCSTAGYAVAKLAEEAAAVAELGRIGGYAVAGAALEAACGNEPRRDSEAQNEHHP